MESPALSPAAAEYSPEEARYVSEKKRTLCVGELFQQDFRTNVRLSFIHSAGRSSVLFRRKREAFHASELLQEDLRTNVRLSFIHSAGRSSVLFRRKREAFHASELLQEDLRT
ncbi:hypothetical protein NE546_17795, partial [Neglectibacter timonensis]|uniref:hypothetical protein n=1 Tax=Neglectibacter timonensis TaxID=1776382 RepID=UPI00210AADE8